MKTPPKMCMSALSASDEARASVPRTLPEVVQLGETSLLPDFTGLSIAEVRKITAGAPLDVEIVGRGAAVAQEPSPGTLLRASDTAVRVWFSSPGAGADKEG